MPRNIVLFDDAIEIGSGYICRLGHYWVSIIAGIDRPVRILLVEIRAHHANELSGQRLLRFKVRLLWNALVLEAMRWRVTIQRDFTPLGVPAAACVL